MSSHFECIGLRATNRESFGTLVDSLIDKAVDEAPSRAPFRHVRWTDSSGASVVFHLRDGQTIECVTPFFVPGSGLSRWQVKTSSPVGDPSCELCGGADCDVLDDDGEVVTRTAVQWMHFLPYRKWLSQPQTFELEVVAFAYQAAFFETAEEFDEGQRRWWDRPDKPEATMPDGRPMRFAENAFMPEGMFAEPGSSITHRAMVVFAGRVELSERLTNTATGGEFQRVRISTLPGVLDTVLDPTAAEGQPTSGKIAFIQAWLVGRPSIRAPEEKTGWWKKVFK